MLPRTRSPRSRSVRALGYGAWAVGMIFWLGCPDSDDLPEPETCGDAPPESVSVTDMSIEVGREVGGQGACMVWVRMHWEGSDLPECLRSQVQLDGLTLDEGFSAAGSPTQRSSEPVYAQVSTPGEPAVRVESYGFVRSALIPVDTYCGEVLPDAGADDAGLTEDGGRSYDGGEVDAGPTTDAALDDAG